MDRLWTPILAHWRSGAADLVRMRAHMRSLSGSVRSVLLAGSTGDGWDVDDGQFAELLSVLDDWETFNSNIEVLVGVLCHSTEAVLRRIGLARELLDRMDPAARIVGVTVCPPVDREADQAAILDHYGAILAASPWPLAVYQLPQVTGCEMTPETIARLAREPQVRWFKDSSGDDVVANAQQDYGSVMLVRGAEGNYVDHLKPRGRYDGWLLSTGNAFARSLRSILDLDDAGSFAEAANLSDRLSAAAARLFAAAADLPFGNAFSNANRAADHVLAYGAAWRDAPAPETVSGAGLPPQLLEAGADVIEKMVGIPGEGYLASP